MEIRRDVFQAIADPTRRQIVGMVANKSQNLNAIAGNFDMSRQAISLHIKILAECGLLHIEQNGRERICSVQPQKLAEVDAWLEPFRALWENRFQRLDTVLTKLKTKENDK